MKTYKSSNEFHTNRIDTSNQRIYLKCWRSIQHINGTVVIVWVFVSLWRRSSESSRSSNTREHSFFAWKRMIWATKLEY